MTHCYGCLKELRSVPSHALSSNSYCPACVQSLWSGKRPKRVQNAIIPLSFSQEDYFLKPIPSETNLRFPKEKPANEHLTMQIARQIFKIPTVVNGIINTSEGTFVYIAKRFDHQGDKTFRQLDFCQLMNRTLESHGSHYKANGSYEELGQVVVQRCQTKLIQLERLFSLILFNYCFGNGNAHLQNFSLLEAAYGDFMLSLAYALVCTIVHYPYDPPLGLPLFQNELIEQTKSGFYNRQDFIKLAELFELKPARVDKIFNRMVTSPPEVEAMIQRSWLSRPAQVVYRKVFEERLQTIL